MTDQDHQAKKPPHSGKQAMPLAVKQGLLVFLVIILMGAAAYPTYAWQHNQLTSSNSHVNQLNKQTQDQKKQISDLQTKTKQLQTTLATTQSALAAAQVALAAVQGPSAATQSDLAISIAGTTYNDSPYCAPLSTSPAFAALNLVITNPTHTLLPLEFGSIKLKDPQNNVYFPIANVFANSACIAGYSVLLSQSIAPGETVRGALFFQVPNSSTHTFELMNGTRTYSVNVQ